MDGYTLKRCYTCREHKTLDNFYSSKAAKDGLYPRCKDCDRVAHQIYVTNNYSRHSENSRNNYLKFKYKITSEDFERLLKEQNYCCKLCSKHQDENKGPGTKDGNQRLAIDHDHITGKVRGLLCNSCNRALGLFNEDPLVLERAAEYIKCQCTW